MASEPLLSKDAINIAGHKLPLPVVMALVAIAGIFIVLRARSSGRSVGAGTVPPAAVSGGVLGQGQEAQLANLTQQLASIQQTLSPPGPPPAATGSVAVPTPFTPAIGPPPQFGPDFVPGVPVLPAPINVTHRLGTPVVQLGNTATQLSTGGDL